MTTIVKVEAGMIVAAVLGFVALALIGKHLQTSGRDQASVARMTFPFLMGLFVLFGFGIIGLGFHGFLLGQGKIGNEDVGPIPALRRNEPYVIAGVWAFLLLGFAIAYPFARRDMLGSMAEDVGPSKGVLQADIGQRMEQVRSASTLPLHATRDIVLDGSTQTVGESVFDFQVPGSSVKFEKCRYYFITTGPKGSGTIDSMNIGISPVKLPKMQSALEEEAVRKRLAADGWEPGRFVWTTEKELQLSDGKPTSGEGRYWAKGNTLLILSSKRMDDAKPGEDPATAGDYILYIDLCSRQKSSYADLVYDKR